MVTFDAHFDGESLRPETAIELPQNVRLRVTVEASSNGVNTPPPNAAAVPGDVFGSIEAKCGLFDGPSDLAAELDHYLYGTPKRADGPQA